MKRMLVLSGVAFSLLIPHAPHARLTRFVVTTVESPTFGGYSWPGVGQYEKIVGKGFGELNPFNPKNSLIVDLKLDVAQVSQILGHARPSITLDVYTHLFDRAAHAADIRERMAESRFGLLLSRSF